GDSTTFTLNGTAHPGTSPIASMAWAIISSTAGATLDAPSSCTSCTTLPATVHVSGGPATATLRLTVTDTAGCSEHDDVVLTVNGPSACSLNGPEPVCPFSTCIYSGPAAMASYSLSISGNAASCRSS